MTLPSSTLLAQSILAGIFTGALYGLLGLGLSLSWGMLRQINLAHFALAFLGAYLTYQLASYGGVDPMLTLLMIVPLFFVFGIAVHWVLSHFKVTLFNSLLITFGLTIIIEAVLQWIWTAYYRRIESSYADPRYRVGELFLSLPELITLGLSIDITVASWLVLNRSDNGKALRAA